MFDGRKYMTFGISNTLTQTLVLTLWRLTNGMEDYFQVFKLSDDNGKQHIEHIQEQPEYKNSFTLDIDTVYEGTVYVIDDGDYSTMLLAEEY